MRLRVLLLIGAFSGAALLRGQQLTVRSATAKAIDVEWSGGAAGAVLERAAGGDFQNIAAADSGHYVDRAIDAFATYKYRVNSGGKLSNVVTVGPPPAGVTNAAPAPGGGAPENFGPATAVAFDENGDPIIAFEWVDPNGDGDRSDSEIRFVRWDRARYKWAAPVRVAVTGEVQSQYVNPIAIACDRADGTIAVLTPKASDQMIYLISSDHGSTWKETPVPGVAAEAHASAMAIASGQVHIAVNLEDAAYYTTGPVADVKSWKKQPVSGGSGWKPQNNSNIGLAVDGAGHAALAFYENHEDPEEHRYVFWRPGSEPVAIIGVKEAVESPDIALAYGGREFGALFEMTLDPKDAEHGIWFSKSPDGAAWSKPAKLPIDGPRSTNPPADVAIGPKGRMVAAFGSNQGSASAGCGFPAVSRSSDGVNWTTCGIGKAAGADFGPQPSNLHVLEAENDKAYVIWQEPAQTRFGPGILVWRER